MYISITIVQSCTGTIMSLLLRYLLQVHSTSGNAKGDKPVILMFLVWLCTLVILISSYNHGISLHAPPPMNVVNVCVTIA